MSFEAMFYEEGTGQLLQQYNKCWLNGYVEKKLRMYVPFGNKFVQHIKKEKKNPALIITKHSIMRAKICQY